MPKEGGATRGCDISGGGERKKTPVDGVGVETLCAAVAEQAAARTQKDAVIDALIPDPPSGVWADSYFAERVTLHWRPCATGVVASELVIGAIDDATRERLDDLGRATSDAIGACVVDARLVAGRRLRFFVTAVLRGADASRFRASEPSRPIHVGAKDFGRVALNQTAVLLEDATALEGLLATPRGARHGKWSSQHHNGAMRMHHVRGLALLRVPRLAKAAAARSRSLYAARSEVVNTANAMACILRFATPYCTPTSAERDAVCNACHRSDQSVGAQHRTARAPVHRRIGAPLERREALHRTSPLVHWSHIRRRQ